ncbi:ATP-binding protein [Streptomyces sp. NPDC014656]|uniref:ATP-binding protein n=1 Tax=Streptomyces sp. NPDC014656 TaxID=3364878 RepID=UPI0036F6EE35
MSTARRDEDVRPDHQDDVPLLRLRLLGGFRAERDGGPPPPGRWPRPSAQNLVKLLAVTPGHSLHREQVRELCWPDATPETAAGSLRVALHAARRALEPELAPRSPSSYLLTDGTLLRLHPRRVRIDANEAERLAVAALARPGNGPHAADALTAALALHTGELLPEDRYAPWAEPRRERLSALRLRLFVALAETRLAGGEAQAAAETMREALAVAPVDERLHQLLMSAYLAQGLRAQAVRQYERCRDSLASVLGVAPAEETERLRGLAVGAPAVRTAGTTPREPAPLPAAVQAAAGESLYGRDTVLERLAAPWDRPVTVLIGEAGVGKTRLAAQAARRLADSGATVLWGAAHDAEGHSPYGPFVEALEGLLAHRPAEERARLASEHPGLAALLPSLAPGPGPVPAQASAPGQSSGADGPVASEEREGLSVSKARLFHGVETLLTDVMSGADLLVVLDDLHAADIGTYHLLARLARRASESGGRPAWRFLVTCRDDEPDTEAGQLRLGELVRSGLARRLAVPRLERRDSLALLADAFAAGGHRADAVQLDRVWRLSLGNPLFAVELARALPEQGAEDTEAAVAPYGVRQLVAQRLARVGKRARLMTEVVAAAGGIAPLSEVLEVAREGLYPPLTAEEASTALEEAVESALLTEQRITAAGRPTTGLAFRHPLLRLTCYGLLGAVRGRRLHTAWGETLLRHRPDDVDALASHFARAEDPRAAHHLRLAAERAAALYANEAAAGYYERLAPLVAGDPRLAAAVALDHGVVLHRMSRYDAAAVVLRAAYGTATAHGDHATAVAATARLAEALIRAGRTQEARRVLDACRPGPATPAGALAAHHLAESILLFQRGGHGESAASAAASARAAEDLAGRPGASARARALAQQAAALGLAGRLDQAQAVAERALSQAVMAEDVATEGLVLSILRENLRRTGRLSEALSAGERACRLADRTGSPEAGAFERSNLAELLDLLDRADSAEELATAAERTAREQAPSALPYALAALAQVRMPERLDEARALLTRGEIASERAADRQALEEVRLALTRLALHRGRPGEALRLLEDLDASPRASCLRGWALARTGRHEDAVELMERETTRAEAAGERLLVVESTTVLALALGLSGKPARAETAFASAERAARALPYPAGLRRIRRARAELAASY